MLKGAKNLATYNEIFKPAKFVMSFHLLKLIGHEIAKSNWDKDKKLVIWTACCIAFFGSFRLGEILLDAAHPNRQVVFARKYLQEQYTHPYRDVSAKNKSQTLRRYIKVDS